MDVVPHDDLTPVTRTTLTADIYRKLVSHIIRGVWKPGARIPAERQLGQLLGVGRASLREALKALEIMGLIETRLGDGTYVCQRSEFLSRPLLWAITSSSETEVHELVEARKLIETELAGLAAERATAEDLKQIGAHLDRMERSLDSSSEFLQSDIEFHLAIGQAAHNSILMNALHLIRNLLQEWIGSTLQLEGSAQKALDHHKAIFLAVAKKNGPAARAGMAAHLAEMARLLVEAQQRRANNASQSAEALALSNAHE
ncbi:MAG TPA: FadR/GntR family transcriptional regulator [Bryobacteraceae bacterium]|jgi:GntR family transcriptional repressor for pyruvate dehydrogenase complex